MANTSYSYQALQLLREALRNVEQNRQGDVPISTHRSQEANIRVEIAVLAVLHHTKFGVTCVDDVNAIKFVRDRGFLPNAEVFFLENIAGDTKLAIQNVCRQVGIPIVESRPPRGPRRAKRENNN